MSKDNEQDHIDPSPMLKNRGEEDTYLRAKLTEINGAIERLTQMLNHSEPYLKFDICF